MTDYRTASLLLLVASLGVGAGCSRKPADPSDAQTLEALAVYNPNPTVDDRGRVVELKLEGPQVDDGALEHVAKFSELKTLSLYGSSITDEGLAMLRDARRLEALGLGKTKVTRRGLIHLERLPALRWLWVSHGSGLTAAQVEDFKKKAVPGITVCQQ
jgi:hypothetical protein